MAVLAAALFAVVPAAYTAPRLNFDSGSYLAPLSVTAERLPLVPLVFAALGHDLRAIVIFQAVVGSACWSYLAVEGLRVCRRPACYVAFVGVLVLSCSDYVTHWYGAILSDSLALSLTALLLASLGAWLSDRGSIWQLTVVAALWAFTRDTNGYLLMLFGIVLFAAVLVRPRLRTVRNVMAAAVAIVSGVAVILSTDLGRLWVQPFLHVTTERILISPSRTAWFAAHGMPVTPTLLHQAGPYYPANDTALRHAPGLASFRAWMYRAGERTYLEYALLHPWWVLMGSFGAHQELTTGGLDYYGGTVARPWLPGAIRDLFGYHRQTTLVVTAVLTGVAAAVRRRSLRGQWQQVLWWLALVVGGLVNLALDWVGDSWEIGRHSVDATVVVFVSLLMIASFALGGKDENKPDGMLVTQISGASRSQASAS